MSGVDRAVLERKLLETGLWIATDDDKLVPTYILWEDRPDSFSEYDARDMHNLLSQDENQIE